MGVTAPHGYLGYSGIFRIFWDIYRKFGRIIPCAVSRKIPSNPRGQH
jgi:hypothetical protein